MSSNLIEDLRIPEGMTVLQVAQTFSAYLNGFSALGVGVETNGESFQGPFRKEAGCDDDWQLDRSGDFWLHLTGDQKFKLVCRYGTQAMILEAMMELFQARFAHLLSQAKRIA